LTFKKKKKFWFISIQNPQKRESLICFCFDVHFEKFFELINKTVDFNNLNNFYHNLTINLGHAMGDNANFSLHHRGNHYQLVDNLVVQIKNQLQTSVDNQLQYLTKEQEKEKACNDDEMKEGERRENRKEEERKEEVRGMKKNVKACMGCNFQ
jgi:hypothetical protein